MCNDFLWNVMFELASNGVENRIFATLNYSQ